MADTKQYGYYIKGNKISIVQKDTSFDNNVDNRDFGQGVQRQLWKSPTSTVSNGLEIEYVYSPSYGLQSDSTTAGEGAFEKLSSSGWFIDNDGFLCFLTVSAVLGGDPLDAHGSSTSYAKALSDDEHIRIEGTRWNGVHKIKSRPTALKYIQTYTKSSSKLNTGPVNNTTEDIYLTAATRALNGDNSTDIWMNRLLSADDFVWVIAAQTGDSGLYKISSITETDGGNETTQKAILGDKYFLNEEDNIDEFQSGTNTISGDDDEFYLYKVKYDPSNIIANVNILDDEDDTIDLSSYLSKALVYYVKAKIAEDMMNIDAKEYFMREFKKMVEKHENSKIKGPRMIIPGSHAIR